MKFIQNPSKLNLHAFKLANDVNKNVFIYHSSARRLVKIFIGEDEECIMKEDETYEFAEQFVLINDLKSIREGYFFPKFCIF